ncbi:MAG: hypothetical protein ABW089_00690 [Sedimenticola sp.]
MSKIIIVVAIVLIIAAAIYFERNRSSGMAKIASGMGLGFSAGQQKLPAELGKKGFDLFTQGAPNIKNLMSGFIDGREVAIFDYAYEAEEGGEGVSDAPLGHDHQINEKRIQMVVWLKLEKSLPDFDLSPTRMHKRTVAGRFGLARITLDGQPVFNENFILLGRDGEKVRQLFSQEVIDHVAGQRDLMVESRGSDLLVYRLSKRTDPDAISAFYQGARRLADLL